MPIFDSVRQAGLPSAIVDLGDFENPLWETFTIDIVPTVLLFNSGKIIQRYDGVAGQGFEGRYYQGCHLEVDLSSRL
jgi:hypothetical protein